VRERYVAPGFRDRPAATEIRRQGSDVELAVLAVRLEVTVNRSLVLAQVLEQPRRLRRVCAAPLLPLLVGELVVLFDLGDLGFVFGIKDLDQFLGSSDTPYHDQSVHEQPEHTADAAIRTHEKRVQELVRGLCEPQREKVALEV
jgi:hypothetical protein